MLITNSSTVKEVNYKEEDKILEITYKSKPSLYLYFDVPKSVYMDLLAADSVGKFIAKVIRPQFMFTELK